MYSSDDTHVHSPFVIDSMSLYFVCFLFNDPAPTEIYTYLHSLSLHDALPICVNSMPASCAIAGRCSPPLVEPPVAATMRAAFSNASRVQMSRGRMFRAISSIT